MNEPRHFSPFLPLLLLLLAVFAWCAFQCVQLLGERGNLADAREAQTAPLEQATQLRAALDSLARKTGRLAEAGNPNARQIVEALRQRGITVNPDALPAAPPYGREAAEP